MTDVAYLCHNCGSAHEVESIRDNLILDLRTAASYELSGHRGILRLRARFRRWRMTWRLAQALWPAHSHRARLARGRRLAPGGPRPELIALDLAEQQQLPALRPGNPAIAGTRPTGRYQRRHLHPATPPDHDRPG